MYADASRIADKLLRQKNTNSGPGLKSMALASQVKNKGKTFAIVCETLK